MFNSLPKLKKDKNGEQYEMTGIYVDGRGEYLETHLPAMEKGLKGHVNFCKALVGFKDLDQVDQIALVKGELNNRVTIFIILIELR